MPDVSGPGLGTGAGAEPGAGTGGATESFVSAVMSGARRRPLTSTLPEDVRTSKTGGVRSVRFADEHVYALSCGAGRGDYDETDACGRLVNVGLTDDFSSLPLASSLDELCANMSPAVDRGLTKPGFSAATGAASGRPGVPQAPHQWLIIVAEHRALLLDYASRAVTDVPYSSLLVEASGPNAATRTVTKGKPSAHCATLIGPGSVAFGCEDGAIRVWSADANAVMQAVRLPGASGRPITHLYTLSTATHAVGSTAGSGGHTPASPGGALARDARTLLVAGCADGTVATFDVIAGRQIAPLPSLVYRLPSDLADLTVGPLTLSAVALATDKTVATWDVSAQLAPGTASGAVMSPQVQAQLRSASSKIGTSSSAAETGVGSRFMAAVALGPHPFFPPQAVLVAGKGPHLELAIPGSPAPGADAGIPLFDLRTARPGLPSKCKVYVLARHPLRPDIVAAGTNIGVFVLGIASQYTAAAASATHPSWRIPASVGLLDAGASGGAKTAVAEGLVTLGVTAAGSLVAIHAAVTSLPSDEDTGEGGLLAGSASLTGMASRAAQAAGASARNLLQGASSRQLGGGKATSGGSLELAAVEHILLQNLAPFSAPLPTIGPASAAAAAAGATPVPNAVAAIAAQLRPLPGPPGTVPPPPLPGTRGVRLRVSGSGRYVAAVWPEYRCYAIYRVTFPRLRSLGSPAPTDAAGGKQWACEFVEGGPGLDVAWAGPSLDGAFDDRHSSSEEASEDTGKGGDDGDTDTEPGTARGETAGAPPRAKTDRFAVIEPGAAVAGRGPMGGGMAIGSVPSAASKDKKRPAAGKGGSGGPAMLSAPATLSLRELPVPDAALGLDAPLVKPTVLIGRLALPQEPVAVWGGPVLALALASDTGSTGAQLSNASLQFFGWALADPPPQSAEEAAKEAALAARYSGLAGEGAKKGREPRIVPVGSSSSTPPPSALGAVNGHGVLWSAAGTAAAVCTPSAVHVLTSFATANGARAVVELCRMPLQASAASWGDDAGSTLFVTTTDARVVAIVPPLLDAAGLADAAAASAAIASRRLQPAVVELQVPVPPAGLPGPLHPTHMPPPGRGVLCPAMCAPVGVLRDHLVTMHWTGRRLPVAPSLGLSPGLQPACLSLTHPGLRAVRALRSGAPYRTVVSDAASLGSLLSPSAQDALASTFVAMGAPAAALLLPRVCLETALALCVAHRADAASGAPAGSARAVDLHVAVGAMLRALSSLDAATVAAYGGRDPSDGGGGVGWWPQVASFLALSAISLPQHASAIKTALSDLAALCREAGCVTDALLCGFSTRSTL